MKKKTVIIIAAIVAIVAAVYFLWFRKRYTIGGTVSRLAFLNESQRKALKNAAKVRKERLADEDEATRQSVEKYQSENGFTQCEAIVFCAASDVLNQGIISRDEAGLIKDEFTNH